MATSRSVAGSSDFIYEFTCTNCSKVGRNAEAEIICITCDEYLCQKCAKQHKLVSKDHKVLNTNDLKSEQRQRLSIHCEEHPGDIVQLYCAEHDAVGCMHCIATYHSHCTKIDTVIRWAKGTLQGQMRNDVTRNLSSKITELKNLASLKTDELSMLTNQRNDILKEIQEFKQGLIDRINQIEKTSRKQIEIRHNELADKLNKDLTMMNDTLTNMESKLDDITYFTGNNEAQLFVHIKQGSKLYSDCKYVTDHAADDHPDEYSFDFSDEIQCLLNGIESFGVIRNADKQQCTALTMEDYDIVDKIFGHRDMITCSITHACDLEDGSFVVTDIQNEKLKKLDRVYHINDVCNLPGRPFGVCQTGPMEVAVTLCEMQQVQFVSMAAKMIRTRSFTVGEKCRGICYSQKELFVSCGGANDESDGQIKVYDINGLLLRSIHSDQDCEKLFSIPGHIAVSTGGTTVHVADRKNGLVLLTRRGRRHTVSSDSRLKGAQGLCLNENDEIFVSCRSSHNIVQLDRRGNLVKELVKYWLKTPSSVTYLRNPKRLIVTFLDCDKLRVIKLS